MSNGRFRGHQKQMSKKCQTNVLRASKMPKKYPKNVLQTFLRHFLDILGTEKATTGSGGFAAAPLWYPLG